jgi:hypothetical protein
LAEDAELPSLAGMTDFVSTAADEGASSAAEADVEGRGGTLLRNILLASLAGLVFLAGATYVLKLRKR